MSKVSETTRNRLTAQGFVDLTDDEVVKLNYWLRLAPAVCMIWVAIGVVLASPVVLLSLVPFALLGGILQGHPFDSIYNHALRHLTGGPALPAYGRPRRFGCLMASVMIASVAVLFASGLDTVARILGAIMIGMAAINVTTGFCVPSAIYALMFGRPVACGFEPRKTS